MWRTLFQMSDKQGEGGEDCRQFATDMILRLSPSNLELLHTVH